MHLGHVRMLALSGAVFRAGKARGLRLSEDGLRAAWQAVDAVKAQAEEPVAAAYARILQDQEAAVLAAWERVGPDQVEAHRQGVAEKGYDLDGMMDAIREAGALPPAVKRARPEDVVFGDLVYDVGAWLAAMEDEIGPLLRDAIEEGFRTGALRIGQDVEFRMTARAEDELARVVGLVKDSSATTRDEIGGIVRRGLESGSSVDEIAAALKERFEDWQGWRARTVAQTSVTSTFEAGQQAAWEEAGVARNRWLSQRDGKVRPSHAEIDGEEVAVGEAFSNGLTHPSEPNCRCSLLPVGFVEPEAKTWREERDEKIRAAYPAMKAEHGSGMAIRLLSEEHAVSERTVERALGWG